MENRVPGRSWECTRIFRTPSRDVLILNLATQPVAGLEAPRRRYLQSPDLAGAHLRAVCRRLDPALLSAFGYAADCAGQETGQDLGVRAGAGRSATA